jgi:hypothetical protein
MKISILLLICCILSFSLAAAEQDPFEPLSKAKGLKCQFSAGWTGDWNKGILKIKQDSMEGSLHFDSIDFKARQARFIGNNGATDVTAVLTAEAATFVERTSSGNFIFTSVFPDYKRGTSEFIAVMSRHVMFLGGPIPSQHHGTCKVWD